jgi:hypothetical protein
MAALRSISQTCSPASPGASADCTTYPLAATGGEVTHALDDCGISLAAHVHHLTESPHTHPDPGHEHTGYTNPYQPVLHDPTHTHGASQAPPSASDPNSLAASASSADVILPAYGLPASARHKNFCLSGNVWLNSLGKLWRGTKVTVRFPPLTTRLAKSIFTSKLANLQKDAQALWYPGCSVSLGFGVAIFPPLQAQYTARSQMSQNTIMFCTSQI